MEVSTARAVLKIKTGMFISMTDSAANELVGTHAMMKSSPFHAIATPSTAPTKREAERLGEQLAHDSATCGAERSPNGELLLAMRAADEQENRDVRAANEQQRDHGAKQQHQLGRHRPGVQLDDAPQLNLELVRVALGSRFRELLETG